MLSGKLTHCRLWWYNISSYSIIQPHLDDEHEICWQRNKNKKIMVMYINASLLCILVWPFVTVLLMSVHWISIFGFIFFKTSYTTLYRSSSVTWGILSELNVWTMFFCYIIVVQGAITGLLGRFNGGLWWLFKSMSWKYMICPRHGLGLKYSRYNLHLGYQSGGLLTLRRLGNA